MRKRKKLFLFSLIGIMMLSCLIGYSQEVHYGRQVTLCWDAVTETVDEEPITVDEDVTYQVYLQHRDTLEIIIIQEILATELTFSYTKGVYVCGVSAIIEYPDGTKIENPDITWSTMMDIERVPVPFYAAFYGVAGVVKNLRITE